MIFLSVLETRRLIKQFLVITFCPLIFSKIVYLMLQLIILILIICLGQYLQILYGMWKTSFLFFRNQPILCNQHFKLLFRLYIHILELLILSVFSFTFFKEAQIVHNIKCPSDFFFGFLVIRLFSLHLHSFLFCTTVFKNMF